MMTHEPYKEPHLKMWSQDKDELMEINILSFSVA